MNTVFGLPNFFRRLNPEKKFGQAGLAEFFFGDGGGLGLYFPFI